MMRIFLVFIALFALGLNPVLGQDAEPDIYLQQDLTKDAEFPGGVTAMQKYFQDNMRYPEAAKKKKLQGSVFVRLYINAVGSVYRADVAMAFHPEFEDEALRLVMEMPNWVPAEINGEKVATTKVVAIPFKLNP